jgi:hypothetical protein
MKELTDFIVSQRDRFEFEHDNVFAFSWSKINRRLAFLDVIERRYIEASKAFLENSAALQDEAPRLIVDLHLEIESYYLFAKIALDNVAHAIEYYFGPARGLSLDSHDDLTKNLAQYAAAKSLVLDADLLERMADLKRRISDVRDYKISHEKSPRTMAGTSWDQDERLARIAMTRLFPRSSDPEQFESEPLPKLREAIHEYLSQVIIFITNNETKTALKTFNRAGTKDRASSKQIHGDGWHLSAVTAGAAKSNFGTFSSTTSGSDQNVQRSSATKSSAKQACRRTRKANKTNGDACSPTPPKNHHRRDARLRRARPIDLLQQLPLLLAPHRGLVPG